MGNSLASGVVPEPGRYARAEGRHWGVVVGIDGVGRRDRFLNWGFESASLFGASRALPYLGRRDRFRIWGVEIASLRQRQMTWQGAPDGAAGRATPQGTGDGASFQIWVGSRGRSEKIATRDWPTHRQGKRRDSSSRYLRPARWPCSWQGPPALIEGVYGSNYGYE